MRMKINTRELEAVSSLPGNKRYEYFIKKIADWESAWGLYDNGWALASGDDKNKLFPIWPAKEFADLCATDDWNSYSPREIPLNDLVNELSFNLERDDINYAVFYTHSNKGIIISPTNLIRDIREELKKYE